MRRDKILKLIYQVIDELNEQLNNKHLLIKQPETVLYGKTGKLDSLGLMTLITSLEEKIEEDFGVCLVLVNEDTWVQNLRPFRNIAFLADYISHLLGKDDT